MSVQYGSKHDFLCDTGVCHRKPDVAIQAVVYGSTEKRLICSECLTHIVEELEIENDQLCLLSIERFFEANDGRKSL